jgi:mono/diheme cytochrome c family protein
MPGQWTKLLDSLMGDRRKSKRKLTVALAAPLLLLASGCGNQGDEHAAGTPAPQLFAQYCAPCHGDKGQGVFIKGVPAINDTRLTQDQIAALIVQGDKEHNMPEFPRMKRADARSVAGYVRRLPAVKAGR